MVMPQFVVANDNTVEFLNPKDGKHNLPFSEAVRVGSTLFLSGQIGLNSNTGKLAPGGIKAETEQTLANINATLTSYGYSKKDVVKCTVMLADIADFGEFNKVYRNFFSKPYPARSTFAVSGLAFNAKIEIECIAAKN
jgi:reactive intermediate/imine deaminase